MSSLSFAFVLEMNFGVSLFLVAPSELAPTRVTRKGFFTSMCPNVGGQVVTPAEGPLADATLEGFLPSMNPDVPSQFVAS